MENDVSCKVMPLLIGMRTSRQMLKPPHSTLAKPIAPDRPPTLLSQPLLNTLLACPCHPTPRPWSQPLATI